LNQLYLGNNQLTVIPESIGQLIALNILGLSNNQLTVIPESIGQLTALNTLYLSNNPLTDLNCAININDKKLDLSDKKYLLFLHILEIYVFLQG